MVDLSSSLQENNLLHQDSAGSFATVACAFRRSVFATAGIITFSEYQLREQYLGKVIKSKKRLVAAIMVDLSVTKTSKSQPLFA